jgi:predicted RNase H-like HicB family nuclease
MQTDRYTARIFWSMDDQTFIAIAPDLPGCSAVGDTQAEALAELQDAIEAWCKAAEAAGNPIPEPSQLEHSA